MGFLRKFFKIYFWLWFVWPLARFFLPKFQVLGPLETLDFIIKNKKSCVRFGDGELSILRGGAGPGFQKQSDELRSSLQKVISSTNDNMLLCVPRVLDVSTLQSLTNRSQKHWKATLSKNIFYIRSMNSQVVYGDALFTRSYIETKNEELCENVFERIKSLCAGRSLVIIEGHSTRLGVGNDLFSRATDIRRILGPARNAYTKIEDILEVACKFPKDCLILIALGPAAKPLVLELTQRGFQAVDLGHADVEYEWFLRKASGKMPLPGKQVHEVRAKYDGSEQLDLTQYNKEVMIRIE